MLNSVQLSATRKVHTVSFVDQREMCVLSRTTGRVFWTRWTWWANSYLFLSYMQCPEWSKPESRDTWVPPAVRAGCCLRLNDDIGVFLKTQKGSKWKGVPVTWRRGWEKDIHDIQKEIHSCWGNRKSSPKEIREILNQKYYQGYSGRTFRQALSVCLPPLLGLIWCFVHGGFSMDCPLPQKHPSSSY